MQKGCLAGRPQANYFAAIRHFGVDNYLIYSQFEAVTGVTALWYMDKGR